MISKLEQEALAFVKKKEGKKPSVAKNIKLHNRTLKVGYRDISIHVVKPDFINENIGSGDYGQFLPKQNRIEIQAQQQPLDEVNTVLHELLHVIINDIGETQKGGVLADEETEEKFIYNAANYLAQVFRDNRWLLDYLQAQFKATKL